MSLENTDLIPEAPMTEEVPAEEPVTEEVPAEAPVTEEAPAEELPEPEAVSVPAKPVKKPRHKPHIALRILLQVLSLCVALVLFVTVLAGVLLGDLRQMVSAGGMKQLISAIFTSAPVSEEPVQPQAVQPQTYGVSLLSSTEDLDIELDEIPEDILAGEDSAQNVDSLIGWLYDQIAENAEEELTITKEQVQSFVEKSTVSDYLAEKLADYTDDFINGTENARITTEELMDLLEENQELLKSELQIELNEETKEKLAASIDKIVVENDINSTIRQTVYETVDTMLESSTGGDLSREDIQQTLQLLTSDTLFLAVVGVCLALILLLCLLNFYNVPAGLTWAAIPCILGGILMSLPMLIVQSVTTSPTEAAVPILTSFVGIFAPVHYGLLGLGLVLLTGSIVWRILRAKLRKKQLAAA